MPEVIFYPEKRKNNLGLLRVKNVPILLFFSFEGQRLQYYSGERIDLKDWDFNHKQVLASHPEYSSINLHLDFLKRRVMEAFRNLKISGQETSMVNLRKRLKELLRKGKTSFFDLLILFIEEKNTEWTLSTYRKIKTFYNHLRNFQSRTNIEPDLARMDDLFLQQLIGYFRNDCKHIDSTIRKNLEVLLWFMNWSLKKDYHRNYDFRKCIDKYLHLNNSLRGQFCLEKNEINAILKYAATEKKEILARDVFIFACLTGLTCQELRMLSPLNIEDDWIRVTSGSRIRSIPLIPQAKSIAVKYLQAGNNTIFPKIYPHKINRYLKEIARKTNLTREIEVTKFANSEKLDASMQAYRLLTFAVARKTFINLALDSAIDPSIVSSTAGYKTMKAVNLHSKKMENRKLEEFKKFGI